MQRFTCQRGESGETENSAPLLPYCLFAAADNQDSQRFAAAAGHNGAATDHERSWVRGPGDYTLADEFKHVSAVALVSPHELKLDRRVRDGRIFAVLHRRGADDELLPSQQTIVVRRSDAEHRFGSTRFYDD